MHTYIVSLMSYPLVKTKHVRPTNRFHALTNLAESQTFDVLLLLYFLPTFSFILFPYQY